MIHWLVQTPDDLPPSFDWLSPEEWLRFNNFSHPKRRGDWLLGRWTAKRLAANVFGGNQHLSEIAVLAALDGSPVLYINGQARFSLSISHSNRHALCALVEAGALGADIEQVAPRIPGFVQEYFTSEEQALVKLVEDAALIAEGAMALQPALMITAIWSGKEAALKALRLGLTVDTRAVNCRIEPGMPTDWKPFGIELDAERIKTTASLRGWWRTMEGFVLTLVTDGQQTPNRSIDS